MDDHFEGAAKVWKESDLEARRWFLAAIALKHPDLVGVPCAGIVEWINKVQDIKTGVSIRSAYPFENLEEALQIVLAYAIATSPESTSKNMLT